MAIRIDDGASPKTGTENARRIGNFIDALSSTGATATTTVATHTVTIAALMNEGILQNAQLSSISSTNAGQGTQLTSLSSTTVGQATQLASLSSRAVGLESRIGILEAFMSSHG